MSSILFICALPEEKKALTDILPPLTGSQCLNSSLSLDVEHYQEGCLDIYVSQSGMGNVNAGAKLALILAQFKIDQIVLIGVAGALHPKLRIGDMVLSSQVIQHDYYSSLKEGNYLMKPGDLILSCDQAHDYNPILESFESQLQLPALQHQSINVLEGIVASGNEFVGTAARKNSIHAQCQNALIVDMEASAIAHIANSFQVPFLIAKTVSDELHSDGSISSDFSSFLLNASRNAAIIAKLIIENNSESHTGLK